MNLETRPFEPGDEVALQASMERLAAALGQPRPGHPALPGYLMRPLGSVPSLERLRWMHQDNPAGRRSLLLWDQFGPLAHTQGAHCRCDRAGRDKHRFYVSFPRLRNCLDHI